MRGDRYQLSLIFLGILVTALFGGFFYRELFPEYKIYQNAYIELEQFRSTYTGESPPQFEARIKQIVLEKEDKGPPVIDRCISCHVALQFSHFSPTRIAYDVNGNIIYDESGIPVQEPNPLYVWAKLDEKIAGLVQDGRQREAEKLAGLKTAKVGESVYDMTKVLRMHPLIGRETRPFEHHPIDEYGCTSCHNGNGEGLTTAKAHGPVFDGQYEEEFMGPEPQFLEEDPRNDPPFARMFNHKPGHNLLFQTTPIYVGALIQANCVQCHKTSEGIFQETIRETGNLAERRARKSQAIQQAYHNELEALASLVEMHNLIRESGVNGTLKQIEQRSADYTLPEQVRNAAGANLSFLLQVSSGKGALAEKNALDAISLRTAAILGSAELAEALYGALKGVKEEEADAALIGFISEHQPEQVLPGTLFAKATAAANDRQRMLFVKAAESTLEKTAENPEVLASIGAEIDQLTKDYARGKELYLAQACYACHRISGFTRGGVGPELTREGEVYPWFIKESMVWPQADLKTSTMPNYHLDHEELEDLMTFLLAQKGRRKADSEAGYKAYVQKWEAGYKMPWERPVNPAELNDVHYGMKVFATQGCAACHRLKGFESDVGFAIEKEGKAEFTALYKEREWFKKVVPEMIGSAELVRALEENGKEIDRRIVNGVRSGSILEEIESENPGLIASFYDQFKFAFRAKNHHYNELASQEPDPLKKEMYLANLAEWKERVRKVMLTYVQEYGLGRLIGPRPNWSGVYRSDEWLMQHFKQPTSHVPYSIMPVLPFDDSKFYSLTHMLDQLALKNRDQLKQIWSLRGFDPALAYELLCAQCHGDSRYGNGPVSEWIYPIPKNLRSADFLRNYTRENVVAALTHGVKGGPMPPWGEVAQDKKTADGIPVLSANEIQQLTDWLFSTLTGGGLLEKGAEVPKWQYTPEDVLEELKNEGHTLEPGPGPEYIEEQEALPGLRAALETDCGTCFAALNPVVYTANGARPQSAEVKEVFDVYPGQGNGLAENMYYIKKRYYTEANLDAGKEFFELNCAVCHGREGEGQGSRAGAMQDAKPRMLTNLNWLESRDDLRLLRSIKYGVRGTSMTPWGDQTSSLQRLQLVMYIRSLSQEQRKRERLLSVMYKTFDTARQTIEMARAAENQRLDALRKEISQSAERLFKLEAALQTDEGKQEQAVALYKKELALKSTLDNRVKVDELLQELLRLVEREKAVYQNLGFTLIGRDFSESVFEKYQALVSLDNGTYSLVEQNLAAEFAPEKEKEIARLGSELLQGIEQQISRKERERSRLEGKLPTIERNERLDELTAEIRGYTQLKNAFVSGLEEARRLRQKQQEIFTKYTKQNSENG